MADARSPITFTISPTESPIKSYITPRICFRSNITLEKKWTIIVFKFQGIGKFFFKVIKQIYCVYAFRNSMLGNFLLCAEYQYYMYWYIYIYIYIYTCYSVSARKFIAMKFNEQLINNRIYSHQNKSSLSAGFEPARGDPNGFLVHRLNHSATTTHT